MKKIAPNSNDHHGSPTCATRQFQQQSHSHSLAWFARLLVVASIVLIALQWTTGGAEIASRTLDIYWNDVEGGGATLIVTPAGESVLIDSGNPGGRDSLRRNGLLDWLAA